MKQPPAIKPVRIMDGDQLAAVVSREAAQITIRPETGYRLTRTTINVTLRKTAPRRRTPHQTTATIHASSLSQEPTP
jgi:hypothetical protein